MPDRRPGFRFPGPPPEEESFRRRGFEPGFSAREAWLEEHTLAFIVAKALEMDLVEDLRAEIAQAIAEGRTVAEFQNDLTPILRKRGWWGKEETKDPKTGKSVPAQPGGPNRLRAIYRSNLRAARAAGQWDRAQRTKKTHPCFLYEPGPGEKHCDRHRARAGTVLPVDDPWWDDHFPPNGRGCTCRVRRIGEAEADRRGGVTARPPRDARTMTDPRTGTKIEVDRGLDPARASNPGKFRGRILMEHLRGKIESDPAAGRVVMERILGGPLFHELRRRPFASLPTGFLGSLTQRALGATNPLVEFPERIVHKQEGRWPGGGGHPELTPEEYRLLPRLIAEPEVILRYQPARRIPEEDLARRLNLISEVGDRCYKVVVGTGKVPGDPGRAGLITFHYLKGGRPYVDEMIRRAETGAHGQEVLRNALPQRKRK